MNRSRASQTLIVLGVASALTILTSIDFASAQRASSQGIPVDLNVSAAPVGVSAEGRRHLVYELHLTNFGRADLKLERIEVIDKRTGALLAAFADQDLRNILARPGATQVPDKAVIAGGMRAVVFLDVTSPDTSPPPGRLLHRLIFKPIAPPSAPV